MKAIRKRNKHGEKIIEPDLAYFNTSPEKKASDAVAIELS